MYCDYVARNKWHIKMALVAPPRSPSGGDSVVLGIVVSLSPLFPSTPCDLGPRQYLRSETTRC